MTATTITVQMFVDFTVDDDGNLTVDFAPRTMDMEFFAFAQIGDRTIHNDEFGVDEPATDDEWDQIQITQDRVEELLRSRDYIVKIRN